MMKRVRRAMNRALRKSERGQGMTEYIVITGLVAILLITAVVMFKDSLKNAFEEGSKKIDEKITQPIRDM